MHDCLVVKNGTERIPVSTDLEGIKRLVEIHGTVNILNFDGSPYLLPDVSSETETKDETKAEAKAEEADHEDKPKRKTK